MTGWRRFVSDGTAAEVTLAIVAAAAGALVYQGFFTTPNHLPVLAFACAVGGLTAALGHRRDWSIALSAVAGPVLVIVFGVFRGDGAAVLAGLRGSWNRLLTVVVPAEPWDELLAVPALVTWAAAFSSVLLVLRTRNALVPLAPPLAGFVFAVVVAGNQAGDHVVATVVFLVAALLLVAVRTHRAVQVASRSITALAAAGLMVAASALLGIAGSQVLASGAHRFDPRDLLAPPIASTDTVSPLSRFKSQLEEDPPRPLFTMRVDRRDAPKIDRVRTAALDVFDGTIWTSADSYRTAGTHLTADPAVTRGKPVTARIELNEFPGPYLPVLGWPSRLATSGDARGRVGFDPRSGVVVSTSSNLAGLSYEMTGQIVERDDDGLARAATTPDHVRVLPEGVPDSLREMAARYQPTQPMARLQALQTDLLTKPNHVNSPPGHSYAAVARMLTDPANAGGFAELHVSAFTLFARMWGFPARVAVGYRLPEYRDGAFQVSTRDAHAWSEVHFEGYGWVVFDPAIYVRGAVVPPAEVPRVAPPSAAPPETAPAAAPPTSSPPHEATEGRGLGPAGVLRHTFLAVPASAVLLVLAAAFVVIAKAGRRKRRRAGPDPAAKVLGAWHELLDRLTERGVSPPVSFTFLEVAEHARAHLGDTASLIETSAQLATTAVYAPEHVSLPDADRAWQLTDQLSTELGSRCDRLRAAADPRPLWTKRRAARCRRLAGESLELGQYR